MITKSKNILNSQVLLKIEPPKKLISNYPRIFLVFILLFFSGILFRAMPRLLRQPQDLLISALAYIIIYFIIAIIFIRLKPRPLLFTEKGITDGSFISVLWSEIEFYNFISLPDIGPNKNRRTLQIISNKPPLYSLRYYGLPRILYDRGLFFSDSELAKAEEIFSAKGISKER